MKKKKRSIGNVIYAIIIGLAVVAFWRGAWGIFDAFLFPNHYLLSSISSLLIGIVVLLSTKNFIRSML